MRQATYCSKTRYRPHLLKIHVLTGPGYGRGITITGVLFCSGSSSLLRIPPLFLRGLEISCCLYCAITIRNEMVSCAAPNISPFVREEWSRVDASASHSRVKMRVPPLLQAWPTIGLGLQVFYVHTAPEFSRIASIHALVVEPSGSSARNHGDFPCSSPCSSEENAVLCTTSSECLRSSKYLAAVVFPFIVAGRFLV